MQYDDRDLHQFPMNTYCLVRLTTELAKLEIQLICAIQKSDKINIKSLLMQCLDFQTFRYFMFNFATSPGRSLSRSASMDSAHLNPFSIEIAMMCVGHTSIAQCETAAGAI